MSGKQVDFIFRYQPGLGGKNLNLIRYLKSYPVKRRKKMILMALNAFWEVDALKEFQMSPDVVVRQGKIQIEILENRLLHLRQSLGLDSDIKLNNQSNKSLTLNNSVKGVIPSDIAPSSDPEPVHVYRNLGINFLHFEENVNY